MNGNWDAENWDAESWQGIKVFSELWKCNRSAWTNKRLDSRVGRLALQPASLWSSSLFKKSLWKDEGFDRDERKNCNESWLWRLDAQNPPSCRKDGKKISTNHICQSMDNTSFIDTYKTNSFKFDLCVIRRKLDLVKCPCTLSPPREKKKNSSHC